MGLRPYSRKLTVVTNGDVKLSILCINMLDSVFSSLSRFLSIVFSYSVLAILFKNRCMIMFTNAMIITE